MAVVKPSTSAAYLGTTWATPAQAYDLTTGNDATTASTGTAVRPTNGTSTKGTLWSGVPALPGGTYSAKTLNVKAQLTAMNDVVGGNAFLIEYSLDGGVSAWTLLANVSAIDASPVNYTVTGISDETLVQVRAVVVAESDGSDMAIMTASIFDIWIDGTGTASEPKKKGAAVTGC